MDNAKRDAVSVWVCDRGLVKYSGNLLSRIKNANHMQSWLPNSRFAHEKYRILFDQVAASLRIPQVNQCVCVCPMRT